MAVDWINNQKEFSIDQFISFTFSAERVAADCVESIVTVWYRSQTRPGAVPHKKVHYKHFEQAGGTAEGDWDEILDQPMNNQKGKVLLGIQCSPVGKTSHLVMFYSEDENNETEHQFMSDIDTEMLPGEKEG
jgi:hypothetical protein